MSPKSHALEPENIKIIVYYIHFMNVPFALVAVCLNREAALLSRVAVSFRPKFIAAGALCPKLASRSVSKMSFTFSCPPGSPACPHYRTEDNPYHYFYEGKVRLRYQQVIEAVAEPGFHSGVPDAPEGLQTGLVQLILFGQLVEGDGQVVGPGQGQRQHLDKKGKIKPLVLAVRDRSGCLQSLWDDGLHESLRNSESHLQELSRGRQISSLKVINVKWRMEINCQLKYRSMLSLISESVILAAPSTRISCIKLPFLSRRRSTRAI